MFLAEEREEILAEPDFATNFFCHLITYNYKKPGKGVRRAYVS